MARIMKNLGKGENNMENSKRLEQEEQMEKQEVSEQKSETEVLETTEKNDEAAGEENRDQEIFLLLVILIGLVLLFQTQIRSVVSNALNQVTSGAGRVTL